MEQPTDAPKDSFDASTNQSDKREEQSRKKEKPETNKTRRDAFWVGFFIALTIAGFFFCLHKLRRDRRDREAYKKSIDETLADVTDIHLERYIEKTYGTGKIIREYNLSLDAIRKIPEGKFKGFMLKDWLERKPETAAAAFEANQPSSRSPERVQAALQRFWESGWRSSLVRWRKWHVDNRDKHEDELLGFIWLESLSVLLGLTRS